MQNSVDFTLNKPQALCLTVNANESWLCCARGSGKTYGISAPWILDKVFSMPRSLGGFIGQTFIDVETNILPNILDAFESLGFVMDEHYTYGKRPPEHWDKCLTPILDYKKVIAFPNGTCIQLISLHDFGSANGKSMQWIFGDEAKFLDPKRLRQEVFPAVRGKKNYFENAQGYCAKLFVTDKYSPSIHWILEKRKLHNQKAVNAVIYWQIELNNLQYKLANLPEGATENNIRKKMRGIEDLLRKLRRKLVYFGEASAFENKQNLPEDFFEAKKKDLTDYEYRIAILNEDPTKVEDGFYNDRTDEHLFDFDADDIDQPLGVCLDYQASISPLVAFQVNDLVEPGRKTLNFLKDFYVLKPLGLMHVVDSFCSYYKDRPCKEVYYFYDHTAVGERNMHDTFAEEVTKYFQKNDWTVTEIYMGKAPKHNIKYLKLKSFYQEKEADSLPVRMHKRECATMILSMDLTEAVEGVNGTEKNKKSERNKEFPQEQSTHFGDTHDMAVWAVNELKLYPSRSSNNNTDMSNVIYFGN